jgi:hypothetical protein
MRRPVNSIAPGIPLFLHIEPHPFGQNKSLKMAIFMADSVKIAENQH